MSSIRLSGTSSGYYDLTVPAAAGTNNIDLSKLPVKDSSGNLAITGALGINTTGTGVSGQFGTGITVRRAVPEVHLQRDDGNGNGGVLMDNASSTRRMYVGTYDTNSETHIGTNGTQRLIINASGHMTMPNQPAFLAYKSGNQSLTAHTLTKITSWSEASDQSNSWDNANARFTAPSAGIYLFGILMQANINGGLHCMIRKNGNNGVYGDNFLDGGDISGGSYTLLMPMSANDYVDYLAYLTANGNINANRSKVWAVKVG